MAQPDEASRQAAAITKKDEGNAAFKERRFHEAIQLYTESLVLTPCHLVFGNRAQSYIHLELHELALRDLNEALRMAPDYMKNINRRSKVLGYLGMNREALVANAIVLRRSPKDKNAPLEREQLISKGEDAHYIDVQQWNSGEEFEEDDMIPIAIGGLEQPDDPSPTVFPAADTVTESSATVDTTIDEDTVPIEIGRYASVVCGKMVVVEDEDTVAPATSAGEATVLMEKEQPAAEDTVHPVDTVANAASEEDTVTENTATDGSVSPVGDTGLVEEAPDAEKTTVLSEGTVLYTVAEQQDTELDPNTALHFQSEEYELEANARANSAAPWAELREESFSSDISDIRSMDGGEPTDGFTTSLRASNDTVEEEKQEDTAAEQKNDGFESEEEAKTPIPIDDSDPPTDPMPTAAVPATVTESVSADTMVDEDTVVDDTVTGNSVATSAVETTVPLEESDETPAAVDTVAPVPAAEVETTVPAEEAPEAATLAEETTVLPECTVLDMAVAEQQDTVVEESNTALHLPPTVVLPVAVDVVVPAEEEDEGKLDGTTSSEERGDTTVPPAEPFVHPIWPSRTTSPIPLSPGSDATYVSAPEVPQQRAAREWYDLMNESSSSDISDMLSMEGEPVEEFTARSVTPNTLVDKEEEEEKEKKEEEEEKPVEDIKPEEAEESNEMEQLTTRPIQKEEAETVSEEEDTVVEETEEDTVVEETEEDTVADKKKEAAVVQKNNYRTFWKPVVVKREDTVVEKKEEDTVIEKMKDKEAVDSLVEMHATVMRAEDTVVKMKETLMKMKDTISKLKMMTNANTVLDKEKEDTVFWSKEDTAKSQKSPRPPKSLLEFTHRLYYLKHDSLAVGKYFLSIGPSSIESVFHNLLDDDHLRAIVEGLIAAASEEAADLAVISSSLYALSSLPRFDLLALFMSDEDKARAFSLIDLLPPTEERELIRENFQETV